MWLFRRKNETNAARVPQARPVARPVRASREPQATQVLGTLDDDRNSLVKDKPKAGFNPYDTGMFDRSKLWESWQNQD